MLSYQVSRSIQIEKTQSEIIDYLKDFTHWSEWSPWSILEPECELSYVHEQGKVGAGYQWSGKRIGKGSIVLESTQAHRLDMELHILRPIKSHAKVTFIATPGDSGCTVEWLMQSKVPWFLFFLKDMFKTMIEMDYQRGLLMLKSQLETGQVLSQLTEVGVRKQNEIHYIGIAGSGTISELGSVMQQNIVRLSDFAEQENLPVSGELFCYYLSMDMKRGYFEFITCLPVQAGVTVSGDVVSGTIPACETYVVEHKGDYQFLGNAWAFVMNISRQTGFKVKSKPLGIERYMNHPNEVDTADLLTRVIVFKK